jgi:DNA repair ATPase RecN
MENHEEMTDLLDDTMVTLTQDVAELTPQSGKGQLDQWIAALSGPENTTEIVALLEQLKTQLEAGNPNPAELQTLLTDLANHTRELGVLAGPEGDIATRLEALAASLVHIGGQIGNQ